NCRSIAVGGMNMKLERRTVTQLEHWGSLAENRGESVKLEHFGRRRMMAFAVLLLLTAGCRNTGSLPTSHDGGIHSTASPSPLVSATSEYASALTTPSIGLTSP